MLAAAFGGARGSLLVRAALLRPAANGAGAAVWHGGSAGFAMLPPPELPVPKLNKKWRRKLPAILEAWGGKMPPPVISTDPEIFAAQQRIFGYRDPSPVKTMRKKNERYFRQAAAVSDWYAPDVSEFKQGVMEELRWKKRELRKGKVLASGESLEEIEAALTVFRYTPDEIRRARKLQGLKRRGKGPPKKGQGKRAAKKKK